MTTKLREHGPVRGGLGGRSEVERAEAHGLVLVDVEHLAVEEAQRVDLLAVVLDLHGVVLKRLLDEVALGHVRPALVEGLEPEGSRRAGSSAPRGMTLRHSGMPFSRPSGSTGSSSVGSAMAGMLRMHHFSGCLSITRPRRSFSVQRVNMAHDARASCSATSAGASRTSSTTSPRGTS